MTVYLKQDRHFTYNVKLRSDCANIVAYESSKYEGWNFNSGNYLFTTDTK